MAGAHLYCPNNPQARLEGFEGDRFADARDIFEEVTLADAFPTFLTLPAYARFLYESREGADATAEAIEDELDAA